MNFIIQVEGINPSANLCTRLNEFDDNEIETLTRAYASQTILLRVV